MSGMYLKTAGTLDLPGAQLCYEIRGSGPTLLLIPGGPADASSFERLVARLTPTYSVVTYDPRGLSRSTIDDQDQAITVTTQADDAHRLLEAVTAEPAYVLGSSGGAITGLELVRRHPEQIRTLIAHEPPLIELLPDREQVVAQNEEVYQTYLQAGAFPALMKFMAMAGLGSDHDVAPPDSQEEPGPEARKAMVGLQRNLDLFFGQMLREITGYRPDVNALRTASTRVVIGCGTTSAGQLAHQTSLALADLLDTPPVHFPGGHGGYTEDPDQFAEVLCAVLSGE